MHNQAVQAVAEHDLAGEAAARLPLRHEGENVALVANGFADGLEPTLVNDAVAGGAGAAATALGANAGYAVVHRAIHHGGARRRLAALAAAVRLNENDCWHVLSSR